MYPTESLKSIVAGTIFILPATEDLVNYLLFFISSDCAQY